MMHIAYSALSDNNSGKALLNNSRTASKKLKLRYRGYQAACKKYEHEIMAIQQYLPGWQPKFK